MTKKVSYVTKEGLKKLQEELDRLQTIERPKISKAIGEAIEKGDISENAEYDAAKDAQGLLEAKIAQLQDTILNCRVIDESQIDTSKVQILNKVTIRNTKTNATMTYTLVSETEADFKAGKLSVTTPIAKALLGRKLGDKVEVQVPAGKMEFEIMDITI
ncbi:MAG: transcription elongation factor GreA [Marinifilaceae bacterium]|nr:transcription elongation factor GreA [Marinifilaceae bacterium]